MKRLISFVFACFLTYFVGISQTTDSFVDQKTSIIGVNIDYAYLLKHTPNLRAIDDAYPTAISVDWSKMLITKNAWEFCNCFPRLGVDLSLWNWDNRDVLGHGILSMAYVEPYFRTQKKINLFFRMGLGGAYLSQPYNEISNPLNESYSTDLSFALMIGTGINYRITDSWNMRFAVKYNHTSNGGISTPNKGLNFPSLSFGVNKSFEPIIYPNLSKIENRPEPEQKKRISFVHFSGWSNAAVGDKDKFYVFGFGGKYSRWIGGRSALTAGTEMIFDFSRREQIKLDNNTNNFVQAAAILGHEFWLGKVTFSQEIGVYYFNDYRINDDIYQRYSLTYNLSKHFFTGFSLKAHRHVADFIDLRIGYTL